MVLVGRNLRSVEKDLGIIFTSLEDSVKDAGVQLFAAEKDGAGA